MDGYISEYGQETFKIRVTRLVYSLIFYSFFGILLTALLSGQAQATLHVCNCTNSPVNPVFDTPEKASATEPGDTHRNELVYVTANQPPRAFGCTKHRINNVAQKFLCTARMCTNATDPDFPGEGGNVSYILWAFGDGQYGSSGYSNCSCIEHIYALWRWRPYGSPEGQYVPFTVILTVTDDGSPKLSSTCSFNVTVFITGDANGDGRVNIIDAVWVGMHFGESCSGGETCCEPLWRDAEADGADLNNDCEVNILDAVIIGANWGYTAWQ